MLPVIDALQLALTAASPLWRGYVADVDCRWDVVAASVDDRTEEERGLKVSSRALSVLLFPCAEIDPGLGVAVERK